MSPAAVWDHIRAGRTPTTGRLAHAVAAEASTLGSDGVVRRLERLEETLLGVGPLAALLEDEEVTDVLVNGTTGVWVDRGRGLEAVACDVGDAVAVRRLAVRLAGQAGRRLDDASPYVDGLLPGGVRLHAVLPPLVAGAAHLSLRVPRRRTPSLEDLRSWGSFGPAMDHVLRRLVATRCSFLVTGGTGSGKTTLLAALLAEVDPGERIVVVEDVAEIVVDHPHVVGLQARAPNVEGRGSVDLSTLVRQSLRMRPDRVVVGEVRGAEVRDMLTALNTGHEGGCGTVHANAPADVVSRIEALGALAGLGPVATRSQLASAIQVIVHVRRLPRGRIVDEIAVLTREEDRIRVQAAVRPAPEGRVRLCGGGPRLGALLDLAGGGAL